MRTGTNCEDYSRTVKDPATSTAMRGRPETAYQDSVEDDVSFFDRASEPFVESRSRLLSRRAGSPEVSPVPRRCHDVPWLIVFALYWVGMLTIATCAVQEGDWKRLVSGMDDDDQLCGEHNQGQGHDNLESQPFVYFACLQYGRRQPTVCVPTCPSLSGHYVRWYNGSVIQCDAAGRSVPATTYPTTALRNSCVPATASLYVLVSAILDVNAFTSVITGILLASEALVLAAAAAAALALLWMISTRFLVDAGLLAPLTIAWALLSLALLTTALWMRAYYLSSAAFSEYIPVLQGSLQVAVNTDMSLALAILVTAFSVGVVVALWFGLLQRLLQAGGILREAAEAARSMPSLLLLPLLLLLLLVLLFAYWLGVSVLLASAGEPYHGQMQYDYRLQWFFWYHTVGLLWTAEVILHLGFCAASAAVTTWYFASIEELVTSNHGSSVLLATWHAIRYAPGSLALGALLVIPGRIFRFFLEHCLHQAQTDGRGKPELRGVANCCLLCCLDCSTKYADCHG